MREQPSLSLGTQAAIEQERRLLFSQAPSVYRFLFRRDDVAKMLGNPVLHRMPASLKQELQHFSSTLFDAEAKHYIKLARDETELQAWLQKLIVQISSEVTKFFEQFSLFHNFHCPSSERLSAVADGLNTRSDHWMKFAETDHDAIMMRAQWALDRAREIQQTNSLPQGQQEVAAPINEQPGAQGLPISHKSAVMRATEMLVDAELRAHAQLYGERKLKELRKSSTDVTVQADPIPALKTIGQRLDDAALHADLSHEQQAFEIGISRSIYFEVKAGRGGKKARAKTLLYLERTES
jgi:hypothetical protein